MADPANGSQPWTTFRDPAVQLTHLIGTFLILMEREEGIDDFNPYAQERRASVRLSVCSLYF